AFSARRGAENGLPLSKSGWDAQMWATARLNQIPVVLSEDLGSRTASVEGVWFVDPFAPEFDPTAFMTSVLV
ncbi:MAG: hypothetical protein QME93_07795, partial [Bacillota bacterium]|nr:hypothetical protein [Bacillota bacterium]